MDDAQAITAELDAYMTHLSLAVRHDSTDMERAVQAAAMYSVGRRLTERLCPKIVHALIALRLRDFGIEEAAFQNYWDFRSIVFMIVNEHTEHWRLSLRDLHKAIVLIDDKLVPLHTFSERFAPARKPAPAARQQESVRGWLDNTVV